MLRAGRQRRVLRRLRHRRQTCLQRVDPRQQDPYNRLCLKQLTSDQLLGDFRRHHQPVAEFPNREKTNQHNSHKRGVNEYNSLCLHPTDAAFAKLPAGTAESLLKPDNKDKLTAILTYLRWPSNGGFRRGQDYAACAGACSASYWSGERYPSVWCSRTGL